MPRLILFAVAEKVILDPEGNASIITLIHGMEAATLQMGTVGDIPKNAVVPRPWTVYSMWKPSHGDMGKEFTQKVQVVYPDGTPFNTTETSFKFEANRSHQTTTNIVGFPIGQIGDVIVKIWLESDRRRVGEEHLWTITVTHRKPAN